MNYPRCSRCGAMLYDAEITNPNHPDKGKILATCPRCGPQFERPRREDE